MSVSKTIAAGCVYFWMGYAAIAGTVYGAPAPDQASPAPIVSGGGLGGVVIATVTLIAVAAAGVYLLKNGGFPMQRHGGLEKKLQVKETKALGNRQFLIVVEYESSKLLLGVTPGKIDYLCPLPQSGVAAVSFSAALDQASGGGAA
jgi:flagellar biogenesis protein FliO